MIDTRMTGTRALTNDSIERKPHLFVMLCLAVATAGLLWLVSDSLVVMLAYLGGLAVLVLAAMSAGGRTQSPMLGERTVPDWSVTRAAIANTSRAIVITDRADRTVCSNDSYAEWFSAETSPLALPFADDWTVVAQDAVRRAWRDGKAEIDRLTGQEGLRTYRVAIERAGRGDDYLLWRFARIVEERSYDGVAERLSGRFGGLMSRAGLEMAFVAQDGIILAHTPGLAERAIGETEASLAGKEFVALLRTDDRDRIFFTREGQQGSPQMLVQIAMDDPAAPPGEEPSPSLMLLIDSAVGIGAGFEGSGRAAIPQLEALLSALPLGLALTDRDGRFLFANKAFARAVEHENRPLPPFPSDLVVREDKSAIADSVRRFARGAATSGDMAVRLKGDKDEPISIGLAGVRGLGEAAVLLSLSDSTEEKRLRRQVAQATKMQAVGQLAGGVAHDFNNVLTAIIGYCDLVLLRHTPGDSDYDDIQQIKANSNRAASLTRQLLAFSRQQTLRPVVLQLPDVVSEVSQLLKRLMGEKIEFSVRHDRQLGPVRADPQQLEQVIVNLAVNARDAMQADAARRGRSDWKGRLTMATRQVSARDVRKMGSDIMPADDYTALIVQDTGGGIPVGVINKIFEPFFTTKELGKGTGLGLSTVYGIVKQSGGFIFADNVPGDGDYPGGARFTVYLPVHKGEVAAPQTKLEAEPKASNWSAGGKLLLVEDEDMVRAVAERALIRAGYSVTSVADGEEGLAAIANGDAEFDLILSDVVMPVMDGPTMARAVRRVRPEVPILFMSGYAEEQLRDEIDIDAMHFIPKPFSVQQISEKVAEVLSEASARG